MHTPSARRTEAAGAAALILCGQHLRRCRLLVVPTPAAATVADVRSPIGPPGRRPGPARRSRGGWAWEGGAPKGVCTAAAATPPGASSASTDNLIGALGGRLPVLALAVRWVGPRQVAGVEENPPSSAAQAELRACVSGVFPWHEKLSYRLIGDAYPGSAGAPYAVGPRTEPYVELSPLPRYRVYLGLQYDWP